MPIEVTEEGIVTLCNESHSLKAQSPIEVTEEGIFIIFDLLKHEISTPSLLISKSLIKRNFEF